MTDEAELEKLLAGALTLDCTRLCISRITGNKSHCDCVRGELVEWLEAKRDEAEEI